MKYLKYFLLLLLITIGLLDLLYVFFRKGYNQYHQFEQSRLNTIFNGEENYDMLFIGSSRTLYHINPKIIDSVLHIESYNAGIDGANLVETSLIMKGYLASHPSPRFIVADISSPGFAVRQNPIFNPNIYYPFLNNKLVFNTLKNYKRVYLLRYMPFMQITECDDFMREGAIKGLMGKTKPVDPTYKGYLESGHDTIPLPFNISYLTTFYDVNQKGVDLLKEMISICKQKNIRLIITYSPVYDLKDEKLNPEFFPTLKKICDSNQVAFFNYRYSAINKNNRLFRDELHLNRFGADVFSAILAGDIKNLATTNMQTAIR
jgi:hypothetical protein